MDSRDGAGSKFAALERLIQERSGYGGGAAGHDSEPDRSLVYLCFEGVEEGHYAALHRSLERLTKRLWGSAALVPLGSTEFAVQLEGWSAVRREQLCTLLETAFQRGLCRLGDDVRLQVRVTSVGRPGRTDRR